MAATKETTKATLRIYGPIGAEYGPDAVTAAGVAAFLEALPPTVTEIDTHVNSIGGNVFEGLAIANQLRAQRAEHGRTIRVRIDGIAASAATVITSAGRPVLVAPDAVLMIHNAYTWAVGDADSMRKAADMLDVINTAIVEGYRTLSTRSVAELLAAMAEETWLTADDALAYGLATEKAPTGEKPGKSAAPSAIVSEFRKMAEPFAAAVAACTTPVELDAAALYAARRQMSQASSPVRAAVVTALPRPPVAPASPDNTPVSAPAVAVMRLCREAGVSDLAEALVADGATLAHVEARVAEAKAAKVAADARATEIRSLCAVAKLPELADGYVRGAMAIDAVRAHLVTVTAKIDSGVIDGSLLPDVTPRGGPGIKPSDIYAERNGKQKGTQR
jgi:ATP-dependent protease ClpP protease subunit